MLTEHAQTNGLLHSRSQENIPAAITDIGCEREINEDRYAVIDSSAGRAWIVCDGMGGTLGGELAAQLAIDAMRRGLEARDYTSPEEAIKSAIDEANRVIVLRRQNPAFSSMGTTIVAVLVHNDEIVIAHAGDSRAYLVRDSVVQQLTVDHTYVQDLVDRGMLNSEEALCHPQAHVLTRCLGAEPRLNIDLQHYWIWNVSSGEPEDKLVLCSDGLYSLLSDQEIAEAVSRMSPQESCVHLVETAKDRGGYDNITLAVLPLGGQLREENPGKRLQSGKKRHTAAHRRPHRAAMSSRTRYMLLAVLGILGVLMAVISVLVAMVGS